MNKCNVSKMNQGIVISETKAYEDIRFFDSENLPKIEGNIPSGISSVEYDVDCSLAKCLDVDDLISKLK